MISRCHYDVSNYIRTSQLCLISRLMIILTSKQLLEKHAIQQLSLTPTMALIRKVLGAAVGMKIRIRKAVSGKSGMSAVLTLLAQREYVIEFLCFQPISASARLRRRFIPPLSFWTFLSRTSASSTNYAIFYTRVLISYHLTPCTAAKRCKCCRTVRLGK